jgi:large subunit ribosomal protein L29
MKAEELRNMTDDELNTKLAELKRELFNLRLVSDVDRDITKSNQITLLRKDIARVHTLKREREILKEKKVSRA